MWSGGRSHQPLPCASARASHCDIREPCAADRHKLGAGWEYDASFAHRSGCALDVELPRLGRTEVEQRTRALAAWMVEEVDYRSRVVVFMGHPLRTKTRGTLTICT